MINNSFGTIIEAYFDPVALRNRGSHNAAEMHRHMFQAADEPACAGGPDGSFAKPVLHRAWEAAHQIGSCHDLTDSRGAHIGWRVEQAGDFRAESAMNCARDHTAQPANLFSSSSDFDVRTA